MDEKNAGASAAHHGVQQTHQRVIDKEPGGKVKAILAASLFILGMGSVLYSPAAQWISDLQQYEANQELADSTRQTVPSELERLRQEAKGYNDALRSGLGFENFEYQKLMLTGKQDAIARLRVPTIGLDQPIRHGMNENAVSNGVGHSEFSSLPIGGLGNHTVLGAHRGLAASKGFTDLPRLKAGDVFYLDSLGETLTYEVTSTRTVTPEEANLVVFDQDRDIVTLLTCTPLGINTHRILVAADRVPGDDAPAGLPDGAISFPWWVVAAVVTVLVASIYLRTKLAKSGYPRDTRSRYKRKECSAPPD